MMKRKEWGKKKREEENKVVITDEEFSQFESSDDLNEVSIIVNDKFSQIQEIRLSQCQSRKIQD